MRTRTVAVVGFALLLSLSGCAALDPGSGDDAGFESVSFPAETGPDGLGNASELLVAHQDRLADDSYRLAFNLTYTVRGETADSTTIVASNESQGRQLLEADLPGRTFDQFLNAERAFARVRSGNETTYDAQSLPASVSDVHHQGARPGSMLQTIVEAGDYTATGTESVDGQTIVTFEATDVRANASGQLPEEIDSVDATLRVDEQGRIWSAEFDAAGRSDGAEQDFHQEYRTLDVGGVTVPRPAWVSNATD